MSFQPITTSGSLEKPADVIYVVNVIFRGLLLIIPDAHGTSCDIGVHRRAADHFLTVAVTARRPSGDDYVIDFHAGPLNGPPLSINVNPPTGDGVFAYVPTPPPFDRSHNNDAQDLQWAIDMQALHGGQLEADDAGIHPGITMSDGIFFTVLRTDHQSIQLILTDPAGTSSDIQSIGQVIGATIWLRAGQSVHLERKENGILRKLDLPLPGDPADTAYEIYVRNDPPGFFVGAGHDELEQYYDVLRKKGGGVITAGERFSLEPRGGPFSTDRIPCMPVLLPQ
jgi:hypothetical protein